MISGTFCLGLFLYTIGVSAHTDWELFESSCSVKESIPNFKYEDISGLGVAVLVNASEDIGTFLDMGCEPNFNGTSLTYIETKCANPIFTKLGISCVRELKIEGYTALVLAVLHGTASAVKTLSQIPQIDLDATTSNYISPLWLAANLGDLEMVRILVDAGANMEVRGGEYLTKPLEVATLVNNLDLVKYLKSKGANVNCLSNTRSTPAIKAAITGNLEILKLLNASGTGSTPAIKAANSGNLEIWKMLNVSGAVEDRMLWKTGCCGRQGAVDDTPLLIAATADNKLDVVDFLISQKVDLNKQDGEGRTALGFAAYHGHLNILQSLVKAGAELDILIGERNHSALSSAILAGNTDVALFLINCGADVDTQSSKGFTSSSLAVQNGNLSVLKALAEAGANLETKGGSLEMTPLAIAAFKGNLEIVQYLKAERVNLDATNNDGKTALDLAREVGNDDVVKVLETNFTCIDCV